MHKRIPLFLATAFVLATLFACSSGKKLTAQAGETTPPPPPYISPTPPQVFGTANLQWVDANGAAQSSSVVFSNPALQPLNQAQSQTLYIQNKGDGNATGVTLQAAAGASPFTFSNSNCAEIAPGVRCSLTATFTPTASGTASAQLNVNYNSGSGARVLNCSLSGNGRDPALPHLTLVPVSTSTAQIDLGAATIGQSRSFQVSITNDGLADANGFLIVLAPTPTPFSVGSNCGSSIPAGTFCTATVTFAPTASFSVGAVSAVATLSYTGADAANPIKMYMRGNIQPQPSPTPSATPSSSPTPLPVCVVDRVANAPGILLNTSVNLRVSLLAGSGPATSASINGSASAPISSGSPAYFYANALADGSYPSFTATVVGPAGSAVCSQGSQLTIPRCSQVVTAVPDNVHTDVTVTSSAASLQINGVTVSLPAPPSIVVSRDYPQVFHNADVPTGISARIYSSLGDYYSCDKGFTIPAWPSVGIWRARFAQGGVEVDFINGPVGVGLPFQLDSYGYTTDNGGAAFIKLSAISTGNFTVPIYQCTTVQPNGAYRHLLTTTSNCEGVSGFFNDTFNGAIPYGRLGYGSTASTQPGMSLTHLDRYFKAIGGLGTYIGLRTDETAWATSSGYSSPVGLSYVVLP